MRLNLGVVCNETIHIFLDIGHSCNCLPVWFSINAWNINFFFLCCTASCCYGYINVLLTTNLNLFLFHCLHFFHMAKLILGFLNTMGYLNWDLVRVWHRFTWQIKYNIHLYYQSILIFRQTHFVLVKIIKKAQK